MDNINIYAFSLDEIDYINGERRWLAQDLNISVSEEFINKFVAQLDALRSETEASISYKCLPVEKICSVDNVDEFRSYISYTKMNLRRNPVVAKSTFNISNMEVVIVLGDRDIGMLKKLCTKKYKKGFREYEEYIVCENSKGDIVFLNFWPWNKKGVITYAN